METTIEKVYYGIPEVAEMIKVSDPTLRFWQDNFSWINPKRDRKNRRRYKIKDIKQLMDIRILLYLGGMTIEGVRTAHELNYYQDLRDFYLKKHESILNVLQKEFYKMSDAED